MRHAAIALTLTLIAAIAAPAAVADDAVSLYGLSADLMDQEEREIGLDVHRGQPTVVAMFYATCPHACPALISDIKRIDAALPEERRAEVRYLLVSLDPDDATATFEQLIAMHGLAADRWRLTKTDASTVRRVAAALGVKYRELPDGSWNHSSILNVLDREGNVVHSVEGLGLEHEETVETLSRLAAEEPES